MIADDISGFRGRIPDVIEEFISSPGGRSLIVKGAPGTGKTTFALEILNSLKGQQKVCYISSRQEEKTLKNHIPWLDFKILLNKGRGAGQEDYGEAVRIERSELNKLESRVEDGDEFLDVPHDPEMGTGVVEGDAVTFDLSMLLPEIDKLYDTIELSIPENVLVAIDSLEGLQEKYGISGHRLFQTLQKDLVEHAKVKIIFIMEREKGSDMDFLGDGVITLEMGDYEGRRSRVLNVEKLRSVPIRNPAFLFTLKDGHFSSCDYKQSGSAGFKHMNLDMILSGLLEKGTYNILEVDQKVPVSIIHNLVYSILGKSLGSSRGTYTIASLRLYGNNNVDALRFFNLENKTGNLKLLNPIPYFNHNIPEELSKKVDGETISEDLGWDFINGLFGNSPEPRTFILDLNMIHSLYGTDSIKDLESHISTLLHNDGTGVGFTWKTSGSLEFDFGISNTLIRIDQIGNNTVLYGQKPHSQLFVISNDPETDTLNLEEIV